MYGDFYCKQPDSVLRQFYRLPALLLLPLAFWQGISHADPDYMDELSAEADSQPVSETVDTQVAGNTGMDDYMSILESEANDIGTSTIESTDDDVSDAGSKPRKKNARLSMEIPQGLDFKEFEEELSINYSGSNILYTKLSNESKHAVYKEYQSDNRISSVRKEIIDQLASN